MTVLLDNYPHPVDAINDLRALEDRYDALVEATIDHHVGGRMMVEIRDRAAEAPWGSGPFRPVLATVEVNSTCPRCNGPRGLPSKLRQHEDGTTYYVDGWTNPCGHNDRYADVLRELGVKMIGRRTV